MSFHHPQRHLVIKLDFHSHFQATERNKNRARKVPFVVLSEMMLEMEGLTDFERAIEEVINYN